MKPEIVSAFSKSSYSAQEGNCLEVALTTDGGRAVRDSKNPARGMQIHASAVWEVFVGAVKCGDLPVQ